MKIVDVPRETPDPMICLAAEGPGGNIVTVRLNRASMIPEGQALVLPSNLGHAVIFLPAQLFDDTVKAEA